MENNKPATMTTGQWMLTIFLASIPLVGLVLYFVWSFGSDVDPNKKNWARATLALSAIYILVCIIIAIFMLIASGSL